jgi:propanol-preferring alcohol dehydrogenase
MRAMVLKAPRSELILEDLPEPQPGEGQVLLSIASCAVCRTDLHVVDGELPNPKLPLVPGHQIVGVVQAVGPGVEVPAVGARVGVPWMAFMCGHCEQCRAGRQNLCVNALFTGYTVDGGYAEMTIARADACLALPDSYTDIQVAPLLCAGLIGYRALRLTGDAKRLGLYGFGASAHIVIQVALHQGRRVFGFTRAADTTAQEFARSLGAEWAGDALGPAPEPLDAAIIFAPAGELVPSALRAVGPGGVVVCAGIHMSDIPSFPYSILWEERVLRSVANLTRADGTEFLAVAPQVPVHTEVEVFPLEEANTALAKLRGGEIRGSAVLSVVEG